MATAMYANSPIASGYVAGIRVVLCEPVDEVRAALRKMIESDSLLMVAAESRDWASCVADVEDFVPELLIVRSSLVPWEWKDRNREDPFGPIVITLQEASNSAVLPFPSRSLSLPIDPDAAFQSLDKAVADIYNRKAKQLHYLVEQYVSSSPRPVPYEAILKGECDGLSVAVRAETIMAIVAAKKCVVLHTRSGRTMLREPIYRVATRLDPSVFIRIHRSVIINRDHLERWSADDKGSHLTLTDGSQYPVGRNYRDALTLLRQSLS